MKEFEKCEKITFLRNFHWWMKLERIILIFFGCILTCQVVSLVYLHIKELYAARKYQELKLSKDVLSFRFEKLLQNGVYLLNSLLIQEKVNQYISLNSTLHYLSDNSVIPKIYLFNEFFLPDYRKHEILSVLQYNLLNPFITKIYLYQDVPFDFSHFVNKEKIITIYNNKRLTAGQVFRYASENLKNEIIILSNNDIYFDNTILNLREIQPKQLYTISRQNTIRGNKIRVNESLQSSFWNMCTFYLGSHDVFVVKSPLEEDLLKQLDKCPLGNWESENAINQLFLEANYELKNPCSRIIVRHLHSFRKKNIDKSKYHQGNEGKFGIQPPEPHGFEKYMKFRVNSKSWKDFSRYWGKKNLKSNL